MLAIAAHGISSSHLRRQSQGPTLTTDGDVGDGGMFFDGEMLAGGILVLFISWVYVIDDMGDVDMVDVNRILSLIF